MIKGCIGLACLVLLTASAPYTSYELDVQDGKGGLEVTFSQEKSVAYATVEEGGDGCRYTLSGTDHKSATSWGGLCVDVKQDGLLPLWQMRVFDGDRVLASIEEAKSGRTTCLNIYDDAGKLVGKAWKASHPQRLCVMSPDGKSAFSELHWPEAGLFTVMDDTPIDPRVHQLLLTYFFHRSWEKAYSPNWEFPKGHSPGFRVVHTQKAPHMSWTTIVGPDAVAQHVMRLTTGQEPVLVTSTSANPTSIHDCSTFARLIPSESVAGDVSTYEVYSSEQRYLGYFHHYWNGPKSRIDLFNASLEFVGALEWAAFHQPVMVYEVKNDRLIPCMTFSHQEMQISDESQLDERMLRLIVGYVLNG